MKKVLGTLALAALAFSVLLTRPLLAAPADAPLLTDAEAKEVAAVINAAILAGFPDADQAVVYSGALRVKATFDPDKERHPLPSLASTMQETHPNSPEITYGYEFDGLHFKLADGTWLIALRHRFTPKRQDQVITSDAKEVNLETLMADAVAAEPFDSEKDADKYLSTIAATSRERAIAYMNRLVPVTRHLRLRPDDAAPALVLLDRAGWKHARELSLAIADQRARNYWQLKPWETPDYRFDPTGAYPGIKEEEAAWKKAHPQFTPEAPADALRRAMFRWCRAQIMVEEPEDAMLTAPVAVAVCKASLDAKDPQDNATRIDALAAGMQLPARVAEGADLATRLQSWEARSRMPRMTVTSPGGGAGGASISTAFVAPVAAYTPDKKDLDALVALLGDERPSRFADFSGPRTVGDNAWRALAVLLKSDPRALAEYPTDHPWTAAERRAAAEAVQKWWKGHRGEYVGK